VMPGDNDVYPPVSSGDYSPLVPVYAMPGSLLTTGLSPVLAHPTPSLLRQHCPIYLRTLALLN
jgi:hypothetical protein